MDFIKEESDDLKIDETFTVKHEDPDEQTVCSTTMHMCCFHTKEERQETMDETDSSEETDDDSDYVMESETEEEDEFKSVAKSNVSNKDSSNPVNGSANRIDDSANETSVVKTSEDTVQTSISNGGTNICFVCHKNVLKIARHFKTHVKEDIDIAKALSLPVGSKTRKELLEKLRNRGNFMHNNNVLKNGCGSLKVRRKAKRESKDYEYCVHCKGLFVRSELWRHMKRCSSKPGDSEHRGRKRVVGLAAMVKSACARTEDEVLKMLSRMNDREISAVIRNDFCLLRFAGCLYSKHGHDPSKRDYILQKIRQLGRFLQTLRKMASIQTMEDAIKPKNFMNVIEAVKESAGFDKSTNSYKSPSLALKIGRSLLKVSDISRCHALMAGDVELIQSSESFQKLYQTKWSEYISPCALGTNSDLKYPDDLPLTEDIKKLNNHLDKSAELGIAALKEAATARNYSNLAHTTLTKIVLFNRRRIGEVSKMKLSSFLQRDRTQETTGLSQYEQKLCKYFSRVELEGNGGRKLAVLLTPDMTNALNLMISKRKESGVPKENSYLFAVPHSRAHYRGHQSLRRLAKECGAKKPNYFRSVELRKEIATTSQILKLKEKEFDQLDDISVHGQFYRLSEPTMQSGKMSKLLLALEKGKLHELRGKSLDQIEDLTDEEDDDKEDDDADEDADEDKDKDDSQNEELVPPEVAQGEDVPAADSPTEMNVSCTGKSTFKRRPWTKPEVNAVMRHFKSHINKGHLATMKECEVCKGCEHPALKKRTVQNIRDFVRNRGLQLKRMAVN